MKKPPTNIAASVRARLLRRAHERNEDFQLVLQRFAAERLLYRIGESQYREEFVLKGAMLFPLWGGPFQRSTRDLDLAGMASTDQDSLVSRFSAVGSMPVEGDGISFATDSIQTEPIGGVTEPVGLRIRFEATLDRALIPTQIDIGFVNAVSPGPMEVVYPSLLELPLPRILAYPPEAVVAEKFHAMVVHDVTNSRLKDFYDLHIIAQQFPFAGSTLVDAIAGTFNLRQTPLTPGLTTALSPAFYVDSLRSEQWIRYLDRNHLQGASRDFVAVGDVLRGFLAPPWESLVQAEPFPYDWTAGGGWR